MTPHRQANHNSHFLILPRTFGRVAADTHRLSAEHMSQARHKEIEIVTHVGPQMGHSHAAVNAVHRAFVCRDETVWREAQSATRRCEAKSIVFHGGVALWRVIQDGGSYRPVPGAEQNGRKTGPQVGQKKFATGEKRLHSATLRGLPTLAEPNNTSSSAPALADRPLIAGCPAAAVRPAVRSARSSQTSCSAFLDQSRQDIAPRCAGALQARSTVMRGSESSWANRARYRRSGLGERFEQLFEEIFAQKIFLRSAGRGVLNSRAKSRMSSWRSASASPSASRRCISSESVIHRSVRYWRSLTSCAAIGAADIQMVSRHRFDGSAKPVIRCRKVQAAVHSVCSPVSDLRRACSYLLADDLPAPSAHTCERIEPSDSCHAFAWHHHLLSDRSGALSPPYAGTVNAGGVRDRGFRKGADGGSPTTSFDSHAKATRGKTASTGRDIEPAPAGLRVGSSVVGSRTATSERMDATAGETAPSFDSANSISVIGSARGTSAMLHPGAVDGSTTKLAGRDSGDRAERRSPNSSSGDGLGIQQPGSMTCGFASQRQPASGRADESATCPAVARNLRRTA